MDYASVFLARTGSMSLTLPQKRWRRALIVIGTCRTLSRKQNPYVSIDIPSKSFLSLKQSLRHIVKEKRTEDLYKLGGVSGLITKLNSHSEHGISSNNDEIRAHRETFGTNTCTKKKPKAFFVHVWEALRNPFLLVLHSNSWYQGMSIFLAVLLATFVSAVSNYMQSKQFDKLASECDSSTVTVVRDSRRQKISIFDVVVGDVVLLNIGDQVPADGVFIEGHSLQVDESSMTGKSHVTNISEREPFLTSGVKVVDGWAHMLITAIGTDTERGEIVGTITHHDNNEATPMQERHWCFTS